jgi:Tfp pilus assembly protein PilV
MRNRDGFTVAEVMCACFIVLLATGGLMASFVMAVRTNRFAANYYNATCLARNRIQEAKVQPYEDLAGFRELRRTVTRDGEEPFAGSADFLNPLYQRETTLTPRMRDCWEVSVKVYYQMVRGKLSTVPVEMKTMISGQIDD